METKKQPTLTELFTDDLRREEDARRLEKLGPNPSAIERVARREAWDLVGAGKLRAGEVPAFVEAREREARARKVAPVDFGGNRRERRALAAQARKVK